jgi:processive 1,2-diacylglycerol beta-glucosyltransferase
LKKLGIPADKITVSGIPIDPVFAEEKSQREMRDKHGLRQDVTTILLSAGGFGVGPVEHILKSLTEMRSPAQIVALCGSNQKLKGKIDRLATSLSPERGLSIRPVGYTKEMDEYMTSSDILLGKPGGLTTSEALAKQMIFVIVNPIPGQEERNSDHLLEEGVAIRCNNLPVLADKIDRLLDDPARMNIMRANANRLARPHAARDVVAKLLSL